MHKLLTGFAALALMLAASAASAQVMTPPPGAKEPITRTPLQRSEYPDGHYTYIMMVEIVPNGVAAPHTHPGLETSYILEGDLTLTIQGQPPRKLKAGDSFSVPPHAVHTGSRRKGNEADRRVRGRQDQADRLARADDAVGAAGAGLIRHARRRSQACADCVNLSALPGIHALLLHAIKTWMAGTSPAMTPSGESGDP